MKLRPYPAYKESGMLWLGRVPKHWECLPHRAIFEEVKEQGHLDEQLLSVTIGRGIIRQEDLLADSSKKDSSNIDKSKYKLVEPGDIAYNKMRAWQGAVGVSKYRGIVSPAYIVERLRGELRPEYFHYLFRTPGFAKEAERWSYGITSDQWSLRPQHFKMIYSCLPPQDEQDAIVRFLHSFDAKVRRFIRNRRRLIEVLNEQKQAIINRAVTRGLDPDVPLKPSGIDWLGDIPEHWEFKKGKFYFREVNQRSSTGKEELLSVSHITGVTPRSQKNIYMFKAGSYVGYKLVMPGQIAVNTMWAWMAAIGVSQYHGIISSSYHTYEQIKKFTFNTDYLDLLLRSKTYKYYYFLNSKGITSSRLRLYPEGFLNLKFLKPPEDEQRHIVNWLKNATASLDAAITRNYKEIDLIREYRTRLISDVVTGKVDVRHLAPPPGSEDLEETVESLEPLEEDIADAVIDDEERVNGPD